MLSYFRELLATLKSIDQSLKELASCVGSAPAHKSYKKALTTQDWNANY
jgi:hypothetical protein